MTNELRDTYNRIASDWHQDHQADDWWVEGTDALISLLPKGGRVLDVGCGAGTKAKYLSKKELRVTGIDFAEKMVALAEANVPEGEFRTFDLHDLDRMEERFDGVFAQAVLLHVPKKEMPLAVKKLARRLLPGGYLYMAVKGMKPGRPEEEVKKESGYGYPYERFFSYFSEKEVAGSLEDAGLTLVYRSAAPAGRAVWLQAIGKLK